MGVRFLCPNGHKLNVKAFLIGKRGICPECDARFIVPQESGTQVEALDGTSPPGPPQTAANSVEPASQSMIIQTAPQAANDIPVPEVWYVRPASGQQYGPADTELMRSWVAEGRVSADSWVWRTGWSDWKASDEALAALSPVAASEPPHDLPPPIPADTDLQVAADQIPPASIISHQRSRRDRARLVTIVLGALVLLLLLALVVVVRR